MDSKHIKWGITSGSTLLTGIYAYYNFEEASGDLLDLVGDLDAVCATVTYGATGRVGDCYDMSGEDTLTWGETDFEITGIFSVNFWMTEPSYFAQGEKLLSVYDNAIYQGWQVSLIDDGVVNHVRFLVNTSGPDAQIDGASSVYDNGWHMITAVYDGSFLRLYIDGVSDATAVSFSTTPTYGTTLAWISEHVGLIDEMGIWTKALTTDEITELYNSGSGKTYPFS